MKRIYLLTNVHFQITTRNSNNNYVFCVDIVIKDLRALLKGNYNYFRVIYYFKAVFLYLVIILIHGSLLNPPRDLL